MGAGNKNTRITFQRKKPTRSGSGEAIPGWADAFTAWAEKQTTGGREFYSAQRLNNETTALFIIGFTQAVNSGMRIKEGNRFYEILPPINDRDNRHIDLMISAREVV